MEFWELAKAENTQAKELDELRASTMRKDQELRSVKANHSKLYSELHTQKESLARENHTLHESRDEHELRAQRLQVELATLEERPVTHFHHRIFACQGPNCPIVCSALFVLLFSRW